MEAHPSQQIVADFHCHYYPCFSAARFLYHANSNLQHPKSSPTKTPTPRCLLIADLQWRSPEVFFKSFDHGKEIQVIKNEQETASYNIHFTDSQDISVIFGYQCITEENLEVLVYGLESPLPNPLKAHTLIKTALREGALVVLPWGFGKWWLKRGRVIKSIISHERDESAENRFYVGDNGNRLRHSRSPTLIKKADSRGIWNLPGSDPLPYSTQVEKVGSMGAIIHGAFYADRPLQSIQEALSNCRKAPEVFGNGTTLREFVKLQAAMQFRKQFHKLTK